MKQTTLCYIEKDGSYLMIHRTRKVNDENRDKWLGIGGKIEEGESPFDCVRREVMEETSLTMDSLSYRGIITFVSDQFGTEYMHLFKCDSFVGVPLSANNEGELEWIDKTKLLSLPMWEGDRIFLELLDTDIPFFSLKLCYSGDKLTGHTLEY